MSREQLVAIGRRRVQHEAAGTQDQAGGVLEVPISNYIDAERWETEMRQVFKRLPLLVGASTEVREPGAYLAGEIMGTPYLISRGSDGQLRAFFNMCSHRGSIITPEGTGTARRHTCPYHSWSYDDQGQLVGILDADDFGDVDRSCLGLTPLPCAERAGLVWLYLSPEPLVDIDTFLCGYGEMIEHLKLDTCHVVGRQQLAGPNWKIAYDGYLDFYHLPILHRESFGAATSSKSMYDAWGPHQRVTTPDARNGDLTQTPEQDWKIEDLIGGVWTIFPHVSMASFDANGKVWMVSMLSPGADPGSSTTTQLFLHAEPPDDAQAAAVADRMAFLHHVVSDEDYYTGLRVQQALRSGGKTVNLFGRNEGGGQRFHTFVEELLDVDDADLSTFFKSKARDPSDGRQ